jgi:hypothetical protein
MNRFETIKDNDFVEGSKRTHKETRKCYRSDGLYCDEKLKASENVSFYF